MSCFQPQRNVQEGGVLTGPFKFLENCVLNIHAETKKIYPVFQASFIAAWLLIIVII